MYICFAYTYTLILLLIGYSECSDKPSNTQGSNSNEDNLPQIGGLSLVDYNDSDEEDNFQVIETSHETTQETGPEEVTEEITDTEGQAEPAKDVETQTDQEQLEPHPQPPPLVYCLVGPQYEYPGYHSTYYQPSQQQQTQPQFSQGYYGPPQEPQQQPTPQYYQQYYQKYYQQPPTQGTGYYGPQYQHQPTQQGPYQPLPGPHQPPAQPGYPIGYQPVPQQPTHQPQPPSQSVIQYYPHPVQPYQPVPPPHQPITQPPQGFQPIPQQLLHYGPYQLPQLPQYQPVQHYYPLPQSQPPQPIQPQQPQPGYQHAPSIPITGPTPPQPQILQPQYYQQPIQFTGPSQPTTQHTQPTIQHSGLQPETIPVEVGSDEEEEPTEPPGPPKKPGEDMEPFKRTLCKEIELFKKDSQGMLVKMTENDYKKIYEDIYKAKYDLYENLELLLYCGETAFEHRPGNEYFLSFIHNKIAGMIIFRRQNGFFIAKKRKGRWIVNGRKNPDYVKLYTHDSYGNDVLLTSEEYYLNFTSSESFKFTFKDGVRCTKIVVFDLTWVKNPEEEFPLSCSITPRKSIILFFKNHFYAYRKLNGEYKTYYRHTQIQ
uniref:Conserved Theileria-specific sub-telomeric protein, SVSP family n=1 Tax=Theileria annulata TaxID=5874 RepID=A0A3B0MI40_THEAN